MKIPHWYVIKPTFRGEFNCAEEMKALGIEHFLPTYARWTLVRHTKGRRREIVLPLLPGYLFGRLAGDDFTKLHDRRRCRHFDAIVKPLNAPRPVFVDDMAIKQLREKCEAGAFDQGKRRGGDGYIAGDRILIIDGPLAGAIATFKDGKTRPGSVRVIIARMFGSDTVTRIEEAFIEAA
ncbi:hypothetical protein NKJ93_02265 [Mesorhizobium sp. M0028]|uniref:transcription termination/antitermination protein NusG n=1 Tax=Mesorhizobium sp. M0028 TaxID=2956849 RepID=UPI00333C7BA5